MGLSLVTAAASEPLSLAEAKSHMRVDEATTSPLSDDDVLINDYISAARQYAEGVTRRAFVDQTWDFTLDRFPLGAIKLPMQPVSSVSYVQYVDTAGSTQTFTYGTSPDTPKYDVYTDGPRTTIVPKYNLVWPNTRVHPSVVTVRFVAGYATFPEDLKQCLRLLVGHQYENREAVIFGFSLVETLPLGVQAFLSPYMMRGFGGG